MILRYNAHVAYVVYIDTHTHTQLEVGQMSHRKHDFRKSEIETLLFMVNFESQYNAGEKMKPWGFYD